MHQLSKLNPEGMQFVWTNAALVLTLGKPSDRNGCILGDFTIKIPCLSECSIKMIKWQRYDVYNSV